MSTATSILTNEVINLHKFFVDWFIGKLDKSEGIKSNACGRHFHQDFHLIAPTGVVLPKENLVDALVRAHNSRSKDFEIQIHDIQILQEIVPQTMFLVCYQEWQRHNQILTARLTTAILEIRPNGQVLWRHVHETWINGRSPQDNSKLQTGIPPSMSMTTPPPKTVRWETPMNNDTRVDRNIPASDTQTGMPEKTRLPPPPPSEATPPVLVSRRRYIFPQLLNFIAKPLWDDKLGCITGIVLNRVEIITLQGTIASDTWLTDANEELEGLCQHTNGTAVSTTKLKRRLGLPEMVFNKAIVKIVLPNNLSFEWTAMGALREWAMAHQDISVGSSSASKHGVSVLKALDAKLWAGKQEATITEFHYDWTFSSPYVHTAGQKWIPLESSGMNRALLEDTSQPILYFDENQIYEDDLHDNGVVKFTIKTRVVPGCAYVLSRLFLRVDGVLLRVKETRLMVDLNLYSVHRDVVWRECLWKDLSNYDLPTDVRAWRMEDGIETETWQILINRLPTVVVPKDIPQFAVLSTE